MTLFYQHREQEYHVKANRRRKFREAIRPILQQVEEDLAKEHPMAGKDGNHEGDLLVSGDEKKKKKRRKKKGKKGQTGGEEVPEEGTAHAQEKKSKEKPHHIKARSKPKQSAQMPSVKGLSASRLEAYGIM